MHNPSMKPHIVLAATVLVVFFSFTAVGADQTIWAPPLLAQIIEEGLANNGEIQAMESQIAALKEKIPFAGSLMDPRIGIGLMNVPSDTFRFDQEPMTQKQLVIAQKVPWFGKLSLKSQRAAMDAARQEAILSAKKLSLEKQIATAYYELGFVDSSQKINDRLYSLVSQLLKVSETRYATGRGLQQDVLQAQVELSKLLDEKIVLAKNRRVLEDRINAMLNRESFSPIDPPQGLDSMDLSLNGQDLKDEALEWHPWLYVRRAEIDQAAVDVELARKDYLPDMDFRLAYGQRDTGQRGQNWADFVSASVMVNVPIWKRTRQDKGLAAARERRQAASELYNDLATRLPHQIDSLVYEIESIQENYRLFKDALIIQAAQAAQSSLSAYEVGGLEFNTMINAQMRLLRVELMADRYLINTYKKRAELEATVGRPLPEQDEGNRQSTISSERTAFGVNRHLSMVAKEIRGPHDNGSSSTWENDQ